MPRNLSAADALPSRSELTETVMDRVETGSPDISCAQRPPYVYYAYARFAGHNQSPAPFVSV